MPAASPLKNPVKVSLLLRRRLRELKRTPRELAEAGKVSEDYMADLVAGRPRPPAPCRAAPVRALTAALRSYAHARTPRRPSPGWPGGASARADPRRGDHLL